MFVCIFIFVHVKFRKADRLLQALKKEWDGAETKHASLVDFAQRRITKMVAEPSVVKPSPVPTSTVTTDTRNQVTAMGKRGISVAEISRSCGLPEGEVDVLLSMARMQRTEA